MIDTCFVGASTVEGMGDEQGLGWPGRLHRREAVDGLVFYNLGVRGQAARAVADRCLAECAVRLPDSVPGLVVISFGNNDIAEFDDGTTRTPVGETLAIAVEAVTRAASWRQTLWVGPVPVDETRMPFFSRLLQKNLTYRNARIQHLNGAFARAAQRIGVPYLDLVTPLSGNPEYLAAIAKGDGLHPNGRGYDIIAQTVHDWSGWRKAVVVTKDERVRPPAQDAARQGMGCGSLNKVSAMNATNAASFGDLCPLAGQRM